MIDIKRPLRAVLPDGFRRNLRKSYDSLYCRTFADKETIGRDSPWTIRTQGLGPDSIVYSGGVGLDISFEIALVERFQLSVFAFDPSPVALNTIRSLHASMANIKFQPLGLAGTIGTVECAVGGDHDGADWLRSGAGQTIPCTTISDEMRKHGHSRIDLLKIDIEGFEYDVLRDCLANRLVIGQICVEFHHFFPDIPRSRTSRVIKDLKRAGFRLIHKRMCEMTFWNENLERSSAIAFA